MHSPAFPPAEKMGAGPNSQRKPKDDSEGLTMVAMSERLVLIAILAIRNRSKSRQLRLEHHFRPRLPFPSLGKGPPFHTIRYTISHLPATGSQQH